MGFVSGKYIIMSEKYQNASIVYHLNTNFTVQVNSDCNEFPIREEEFVWEGTGQINWTYDPDPPPPCGLFEVNYETRGTIMGKMWIGSEYFYLQGELLDTLGIQASYMKKLKFYPLTFQMKETDVDVKMWLDSLYYPDSEVFPVISIGKCLTPQDSLPKACRNFETWPIEPVSRAPLTYDPNHLVDELWPRYQPSGLVTLSEKTEMDGMKMDGVRYEIETSLNQIEEECGQMERKETDMSVNYHFNVSYNLYTGKSDCTTQPYLIRINKQFHSILSYEEKTGMTVEVFKVSYEPCLDCSRAYGGYSCGKDHNYRLKVELMIKMEREYFYEGFRQNSDVKGTSENEYGFPERNLTRWKVSEKNGELRTELELYTACLNVWDDNMHTMDCDRFNMNGISDYSLYLNFRQCEEISCLQNQTKECDCVDNPPDHLYVEIDLQLHE